MENEMEKATLENGGIEMREATTSIRFVPRRGRMILQQKHRIHGAYEIREAWVDVPVETEDARHGE